MSQHILFTTERYKMSDTHTLVGKTIGKYRLDRMIGEGGMSQVYLGTHVDLDVHVAVKVLLPSLTRSPEVRERFRREGNVQFRLQHPNIVRVTDLIEEDNLLCIVMDWIDGQDLLSYIKEVNGPIPLQDVQRLFLPVLDAITFAHSHQVIHRDMKPANILLDGPRGAEIPKVVDFGVAKSLADNSFKTQTGSVLGTPYYIAPEVSQSKGKPDERVDVYALGVMLFYMLTGRLPFIGSNAIEVIGAHLFQPIPPLGDFLDVVPNGLDEVLQKALAKNPADRFPDCPAFRQELQVVLESSFAGHTVDVQEAIPSMIAEQHLHNRELPSGVPLNELIPDDEGPNERFKKTEQRGVDLATGMFVEEDTPELAQAAEAIDNRPTDAQMHVPELKDSELIAPKRQSSALMFVLGGIVLVLLLVFAFFAGSLFSQRQALTLPDGPGTHVGRRQPPRRGPVKEPVRRRVVKRAPVVPERRVVKPRPLPRVRTRAVLHRRSVRPRRVIRRRVTKRRVTSVVASFSRCRRCVRRYFAKINSNPGFQIGRYHGVCGADDFQSAGKRCARSCGRKFLYYCAAYLKHPFRKPGRSLSRIPAGRIPACREYTKDKGFLRVFRRSYPRQDLRKIARSCLRRWKHLR
ncbi:MAG: hypothetical protein CL920_23085 [Deltaproteobacteria bacterium]|nr:hypothetical protein [Deltaproteobacteria bacterium]